MTKHYTPSLKRFLVSALYHQAKVEQVPMTTLLNRIVEQALINSAGWQQAQNHLKDSTPAPTAGP